LIGNWLKRHEQLMPDNSGLRLKLNVLAEPMILTSYLFLFLTSVILLSGNTYKPFIYFRF
jgi:hypothetical protein